jgi:hypothetical protein
MNTTMRLNYKNILAIFLVVFLAIGMGFLGFYCGNKTIKQFLFANSIYPLFYPAYAQKYYSVVFLLNSPDMFDRLSGYYGLADMRNIDEDFIFSRFEHEENPVIKQTLIWLLSYSNNKKATFKRLEEIWDLQSDEIKSEILNTLEKLDYKAYKEFLTNKGIKHNMLINK